MTIPQQPAPTAEPDDRRPGIPAPEVPLCHHAAAAGSIPRRRLGRTMAAMTRVGAERVVGRYWPLLLPGAYALHLAEEAWGGPGFVRWAVEHLSPDFTTTRFLLVNVVAWPAMLVASLVASLVPAVRWLVAALAAILLVNAALHLGATIVTRAYVPGLISAVLVYVPVGVACLRRVARESSPSKLALGAALGVAIHAAVVAAAF